MSERTYTKEQLQVIEHAGAHAIVAAVAGSGKTETLIGRVRHLLRDVSPVHIAVVMFNRDAALSFRRRFEQAVQGTAPEIRTFNSMGNKIVNRLVQNGLLPEARIEPKDHLRTKIAKDAFTRVFKAINGSNVTPDKELIDGFISFLLLVKSSTLSPEEVFETRQYGTIAKGYVEAFHLYEEHRSHLKVRFFEDQLYDPVKLMLRQPETQRYVHNRVDHLIVDEAQDMNGIQIALLKILAGDRAKVMLVGDEDQAIYDWRGAEPDYLIRGFEQDFPDATRYTLPHTFRFGHMLSIAASQVITRNANRNSKISISAKGTPRTRIRCLSLTLGLADLGEHVAELLTSGVKLQDIAVLVRTYDLSVTLELDLHQRSIPYHVYGRPPLMRIPEISALLGVLQLASGRWKNLEADQLRYVIKSLLHRPTLYLDKAAINRVVELVVRQPERLVEAIRSTITLQTKDFQANQIRDRADLLEILATATDPQEKVLTVLDRYLLATEFERNIEKQSPTADQAATVMANIQAFRLIASRHEGSIDEFLDNIDPLIDSSTMEPPTTPHVWISSIHRAKGAQWSRVFVPGAVRGVIPRDNLSADEIEAERRLFYVAITRAVDEVFIAHPNDLEFQRSLERPDITETHPETSSVSRFLWEMDIALARHAGAAVEEERFEALGEVDRPEIANAYFTTFPFSKDWRYAKRPQPSSPASMGANPNIFGAAKGTRVIHAIFGSGTIDRWIDDRVLRVVFDDGDTRLLVASMAPMEIASA
ncbi:TPA: ATP-dependent helicase [Pseudomonas aeruginosa]